MIFCTVLSAHGFFFPARIFFFLGEQWSHLVMTTAVYKASTFARARQPMGGGNRKKERKKKQACHRNYRKLVFAGFWGRVPTFGLLSFLRCIS